MSVLTIWKSPQELMPTYNQVIVVATHSLQSEINFQLVTSIWCRGTNVTKVKTPPNPDGYIIVDLHKHLENRVSYDFNPGLTGFNIATNSFATYSLFFSAEFRHEWRFLDNVYSPIGPNQYVGFISRQTPYFSVGDSIYIAQDSPYTNASYNGVHTILAITQSGLTWSITTDAAWGVSTGAEPGLMTYAEYTLTTIPVTSMTIYSTPTQSSTASVFPEKYVFNGVLGFTDFINWNFDDWDANTTNNGKFFTNAPDDYELDIDSQVYLNLYQNADNEVKTLKIATNLGTFSVTNPFTSITLDQRRFLQINGSPKDLYNLGWINSSTKSIEIWCENNSGQKTIASKTFKISDRCSKYDKMQIIFMDKMGSFLPYTFNKVNRMNKTINRQDYQQHYGNYAASQNNWNYKTYDRGRKNLDTQITEQYTLNSDWVDQNTSDYLMELFESPETYLVNPDGVIVAINLNVQSVERKQVINEQLINYVLTFELSNKNMTQRG